MPEEKHGTGRKHDEYNAPVHSCPQPAYLFERLPVFR